MRNSACWTCLLLALSLSLSAQDDLPPVTRTYAITHVNIVQAPGRKIDMGTVVLKDGVITAVGKGVAIPPEAIVIKADSMYVYAGFIDGLSRTGVIRPKEETNRERPKDPGNPTPERAGITPQVDVRYALNPADKSIEDLRQAGFAISQVVPYGGMLPGSGALILLSGKSADQLVIQTKSALYAELTGASGVYPNTVIGVMAKWRDLYRNAVQSKNYESLYASNRSGLERPVTDRNLEAFYPVIDQKIPVLFKAEKLLEVQRVLTLKNDLKFPLTLAEVKEGWHAIPKIKASGASVFLSLDLPEEMKKDEKKDGKKKDDKPRTAAETEKEQLEKRRAEAISHYTAQAAAFQKAGVRFGFSMLNAKPKDVHANLRRMIAAGLSEDAALAALTTSPAQLLGISDRAGTVDPGKMANLVISDKPFFSEKAKIRYVFVDGAMTKLEIKETKKSDPNAKVEIEGTWNTTTQSPQGTTTGKLVFKKDGSGYTGTASSSMSPDPFPLKDIVLEGNALSFKYTMSFGSRSIDVEISVTVEGDSFKGNTSVGSFGSFPVEGTKNPK
ncbi:MAG: amidohydrolase family protein [Cyclobacteriaceae bacterium]|nr:amidohydrolase family protein [Cyclobacteriaceae bacterium]